MAPKSGITCQTSVYMDNVSLQKILKEKMVDGETKPYKVVSLPPFPKFI
jgi:hypothetical protein